MFGTCSEPRRSPCCLCQALGCLYGCDGTFLFPQANGHVSQDQEEAVYPEGTARAPAEEETQVGPPLGSVPLPSLFHGCSGAIKRKLSSDSQAVCGGSPCRVECGASVPSKLASQNASN